MTQFDLNTRASAIIGRGTLSGGISQQPPLSRFPIQIDDAENFNFSVFDGMSKRSGTELTRVITGLVKYDGGAGTTLNSGGDYRLHEIRRSEAEQYVVLYGHDDAGDMRVWPLEEGGPPALVTYGTDVLTYLNYGGATPDDLIFRTVADGTFIVNKLVPTGLITSPSYTLTTTFRTADIMISNSPDEGTYHRALADGDDFDAGYYIYSQGADGRTFARWQCEKEHINWTGWDEFNSRDWGDTAKSDMGFRVGFRRVNVSGTGFTLAPSGSNYQLTAGSGTPFSAYTFEAGDMIRITGGTGVVFPGAETFGWATVISKDSSTQITVAEANVSGVLTYRAGTSVSLAAATTVNINGVGREYEVATDIPSKFASGDVTDLYDIAAAWQQAFQDVGEDDVTVSWIKIGTTGEWRITSPWKGGDSLVYETQSPLVATYDMTADDRPFTNTSGEYGTTAGAAGTFGSNATARFVLQDRWTRTAAPSQPEWKPDPDKMPVLMTRTAYTGNGTTPAEFSIDQIAWTGRDTGDEDTNLAPELFRLAHKITALAIHEERLVLGGGPYVLNSEAGNFYNFYKVDDTILADSDRIEKLMPGDSVATVWDVKPIRRSLFVKTNAAKAYEMSTDSTWTPTNVTITEVMSDELLDVETPSMDSRLYVATRKHSRNSARVASSIKEYAYEEARAGNTTEDITYHVPLFFEDDIRRIIAVPAENMIVVLNDSDRHTLYVWRTFFSAGNVRQQSAWTKYTFDASICDLCLVTSGLHILFENGVGTYTQEYLRFEPDITSLSNKPSYGPEDYPRRMDCQFTMLAGTGTYNGGGNYTQWTLVDPYSNSLASNDIDNMIVNNTGVEYSVTRPSSTTIRATGDFSSLNVRFGIKYNATCNFSREYVRGENTNIPVASHGFVVQQQVYSIRRSGPFSAVIRRDSGMGDFTSTFTPSGGTPLQEEGIFRVSCGGPVESVSFRITSENGRPVVIPTATFIGVPIPLTS